MDSCIVVKTILMSVPWSPNANTRPTSPMPRHFIIIDTGVVFPLPNSRLCHNQRNANTRVIGHNIDVGIFLVVESLDQAVDVATICSYIYGGLHRFLDPHSICVVGESFSLLMIFVSAPLCCGYLHDCIHVGRLVSIVSLIE